MAEEKYVVEVHIDADMVEDYIDDFRFLVGGHHREEVLNMRRAIMTVLTMLWEQPDLLENEVVQNELIRIMAMREAMLELGIFYDA